MKTYTIPCERCNGKGKLSHFNHVDEGLCFKCSGSKFEEVNEEKFNIYIDNQKYNVTREKERLEKIERCRIKEHNEPILDRINRIKQELINETDEEWIIIISNKIKEYESKLL